LKEIKEKFEKHMTRDIIDNLLNNINVSSYDNSQKKFDIKFDELRNIEEKIENLQIQITDIKTNGEEKRFLLFEAEGLKLLEQLDKIEDLSDQKFEELRVERRKAIQRLKQLSEKLKQFSIENLKQLLSDVYKRVNEQKTYEVLLNDIVVFINESKSLTFKEIDDYRYQLEDIKYKL